jgi:hypothetical protein
MEYTSTAFKRIATFMAAFAILLIALLVIVPLRSTITGFSVEDSLGGAKYGANYTDELNQSFEDGDSLVWTPPKDCADCVLSSLKVSGRIEASKSGRSQIKLDVLDKKLVLDNDIVLETTTITQEITEEENISSLNETTNEKYTETFVTTREVNYTAEVPATVYFDEVCVDTCAFSTERKNSYKLVFNLADNNTLYLDLITYQWASPETNEIATINETNVTTNGTNVITNETVYALNTLNFSSRADNAQVPINWFIKHESSGEDTDNALWEWKAVNDARNMVINFASLRRPQAEYQSQQLKIYSRELIVDRQGTYRLSFSYVPNFIGECLQLGLDTYSAEGNPKNTYILNLGEKSVLDTSDFNYSIEKIGKENKVDANGVFSLEPSTHLQFYFAALCDDGSVELSNFTYTFINT